MARLNITVPDGLYAHLEQLRDRINLSKVCAIALEKEVTMLEGQPNITDPRIARLVQRLQSVRERWYQRGSEDGIQWAVELATRDELQGVATHLAAQDGQQLAALFLQMQPNTQRTFFAPVPPHLPGLPGHPSMPHAVHVQAPAPHTLQLPPLPPGVPPPPPGTHLVFSHHPSVPFAGFPTSFHAAERLQSWQDQDRERSGQEGETPRVEVDEGAYLEGWRDAVKGIWQTISPALS